jgi:type I restriction enzyme S subunit
MKKYKSYSTYKPSGVEWLGNIPEHWELRKLKFIADLIMGQSPDSSDYNYEEIGVPFLQGTAEFGTINPNPRLSCGSAKKYAIKDDLLLSVRAPVGEINVADQVYGIGRGLCAIRPRINVFNKIFTRYFLEIGKVELISGATGSIYDAVTVNQVANLQCLIPPLKEQESIANFLDRETTRIDTLITKKRELINLLQHKHTIIITNAVTKGMDHNVLMKDSGVAWIGEVPKHWEVKRIKFVCRLETGHTPNRSEKSYWIEEECTIPWVSLNDTKALAISDYISETKYNISPTGMANSSAHLIEPGAVVFTRDATIGLAAITTEFMAVSQHIIAWVCLPGIYNIFLLHIIYAMKNELERLTMGSTIKTIGMTDIKDLRMPIPPLGEQVKIIDKLNKKKQLMNCVKSVKL